MEIYIAKSGKEAGPFTKEQVTGMVESGMVAPGDSVWHVGLPEWVPVHRFLGVRPPVPVVIPDEIDPSARRRGSQGSRLSGDPAPFESRAKAHFVDSAICLPLIIGFGMVVGPVIVADNHSVIATTLQMILVGLSLILPSWLYHACWESSALRASPGKILARLVVTDLGGRRLGFLQASMRSLRKSASQLLAAILIGMTGIVPYFLDNPFARFTAFDVLSGVVFLWSLRSRRGQCLHDSMSRCLVVVK